MTDDILAAGLGSIAMLSAFAVNAVAKHVGRRHTRALLRTTPCPGCGNVFGYGAVALLDEAHYHWTLSRGNTASSLALPHDTFQITCPRCQTLAEYGENGQAFVLPQVGVIGFTRTIKSKTAPNPGFDTETKTSVKTAHA
jgi:hypothetical protein